MVNYRYDRAKIAANAGAYLADGSISTSAQVAEPGEDHEAVSGSAVVADAAIESILWSATGGRG